MRAKTPFLSLKRSYICGFLCLAAVALVLGALQLRELQLQAAGGNPDGNIYWRGDFETGDFRHWAGVHQGSSWDSNSSAKIVTSPVPPGYHYAAKLTVIPNGNESARVELSATRAETAGIAPARRAAPHAAGGPTWRRRRPRGAREKPTG